MKEFDLYVVRHGQTYYNIYRKMQGWSNTPLTNRGLEDAEKIGNKLSDIKFDAFYTSDMARAEKTAKVIHDKNNYSANENIISSQLLRGAFFGYYEGSNIDETCHTIAASNGFSSYKKMVQEAGLGKIKDTFHEVDPFHQAENNDQYWKRWDEGFRNIMNNKDITDNGKVLLVSHGPAVLSLVDRFAHGKYDVSVRPKNGSLTKLHFDKEGSISVLSYNEV
ncbi:phosphoglycerate mutase family protein [Apilactobacillus apisilvae]|uniref:Phosphoglycerate mutase family protein n=1 Tax=Apilactobacillus apisilvae TaxID=2923364 RepID=A0ABY4PH32_9LACO|nr:histidine phosphatase family protein [Apilactobacillus apisilvae]UQS85128.1 phosphoglycerate mutase family protein [Apilactobacillus apisilvae]